MCDKTYTEKRKYVYSMILSRNARLRDVKKYYEKFIDLERIPKLYNSRPCGIGRMSIHAEQIAINHYVRTHKKELKKGFTICTMRLYKDQCTKEYKYGNSMPCAKCLFRTIRKILENNKVNPEKINIIYSDGIKVIKIPYLELCKEPNHISSANRR